jgi:phenylacetate-coenzyme A ligase PaaK-like adenylate-forming protein
VATAWDRHSAKSLAALQDKLVRDQVRTAIAPYSPLWRDYFDDRGPVKSVGALAKLPALGERDVSPAGDATAMSALVLQQEGDAGFAVPGVVADRRRSRGRRRAPDGGATSFVFAGHGFRYPIASTRSDLELIAHAGARLWSLLGLSSRDVLLSAVPPGATTEHVALQYAALVSGAPAMFPGSDADSLQAAARLAPPTVLALPAATAPQILNPLRGLSEVRTMLLVGAPTDAERIAAAHGLFRADGPSDTVILGVHAPVGARVLWGECRESGGSSGLHTYPDLEVVQTVDPDTGERAAVAGEVVLTQLGFRGSALMRWRTGDVVESLTSEPCPTCGRRVPRLVGLHRAALIARFEDGRALDLRSIAAVLVNRPDIRDWRVVVGRRGRDGVMSAFVHYEALNPDDPATVIGVAKDIRQATGILPTQLVSATRDELDLVGGAPLSPRSRRG